MQITDMWHIFYLLALAINFFIIPVENRSFSWLQTTWTEVPAVDDELILRSFL